MTQVSPIHYGPVTRHLLRRHRWRTVIPYLPDGFTYVEQCSRCHVIRTTHGVSAERATFTPAQWRAQSRINEMPAQLWIVPNCEDWS